MEPRGSILWRLVGLGACVLALVAASTLLGYRWIPFAEIFGEPPSAAYWQLRVPRAALAAAAGAGLALGGVVFQALFRNPLAEPYTLGVASGAAVMAALGFLMGWSGTILGVPRLALLAFVGAAAAIGLVYAMSRIRVGADMAHLLLAGVCVSYLGSAGVVLITYLTEPTVTNEVIHWMMGSLAVYRPTAGLEVLAVFVPVLGFVVYSHRALDLLAMGEQLAASRGVDVGRVVWLSFGLVGLLTAFIVGNCGPIGFVGLMVPHFGRALFGLRTLPLAIGSALLGAGFLAVCDALARVPAHELPVGVLTNMLGASFFFYLLATRDTSFAAQRA